MCLQIAGRTIDLAQSDEEVKKVKLTIRRYRDEVDVYHDAWYKKAVGLATQLGIEPMIPRMYGRQAHRNNVPVTDVSNYFKHAITLHLLDKAHKLSIYVMLPQLYVYIFIYKVNLCLVIYAYCISKVSYPDTMDQELHTRFPNNTRHSILLLMPSCVIDESIGDVIHWKASTLEALGVYKNDLPIPVTSDMELTLVQLLVRFIKERC